MILLRSLEGPGSSRLVPTYGTHLSPAPIQPSMPKDGSFGVASTSFWPYSSAFFLFVLYFIFFFSGPIAIAKCFINLTHKQHQAAGLGVD